MVLDKKRCPWAPISDHKYLQYHDTEWGVPVFDDNKLFEMLVLEGAQAGLSWRTILYRRENYRDCFHGFIPEKVARMCEKDINTLMINGGIIRNRQKISSAINNAKVFIKISEDFGSFSNYCWGWLDGKPIINQFKTMNEVPAFTPLSESLGKDLKQRGMSFVGATIIYSFMQATGMTNDHLTSCFRHKELGG